MGFRGKDEEQLMETLEKLEIKCKELEDFLRETEERYLSVLQSISDAVISIDENGNIFFWNRGAENIFGYSSEEIVGKPLTIILPEEFRGRHQEGVKRVFATGESKFFGKPFEMVGLRRDGTQIPVEITCSLWRGKERTIMTAIIRDISERKKAEKDLRESEEKHRVLFNSTLDGLFVVDSNLRVVLANEAAARMYGFSSPGEVVGLNPLDFVCPEDRERARKAIVEDMFEKDLRQVNEFRTVTKDGREVWIEAVGTRTEYGGKTVGLVSIRDITARKKAEKKLRAARERTDLLADILGHDVNNINQGILLDLHMLREAKTKEEFEEIVDRIERHVERSANLVDKVRKIRQLELGVELETQDLGPQIEKAVKQVCEHPEKKVLARIEKPEKPLLVHASKLLPIVFENVLGNAVTHSQKKEVSIWVKVLEEKDHYKILVEDNGPGVPDQMKKTVFERIETQNGKTKGIGLGLALCKEIVEGSKGGIWVEDRVEGDHTQGTRIVIKLPKP